MRLHFAAVSCASLLAVAAFAGCLTNAREGAALDAAGAPPIQSAGTQTASGNLTHAGGMAMPATAAPPTTDAPAKWVRGQWWTYRPSGMGAGAPVTAIVVEAGPGGYKVAVDEPTLAAYDAATDVSWLGDRGTDLGGSQGSGSIAFYVWPLVDGATWQTKWDGLTLNMTAHRASAVPTPSGPEAGFDIVGMAGAQKYVAYNYAPSVGTFTRLVFGDNFYALDMTAAGHNYTGTYYVERASRLASLSGTGPTPAGSGGPFTVDANQDFLFASYGISGNTVVAGALALVPPSGQPFTDYAAAPGPAGASATMLMPKPAAGTWAWAAAGEEAQTGGLFLTLAEIQLTPTHL
ncbi:MAG: hypothetical protein ACYDCK_01225 [Thermoplasmatota archaeon]